MTNISKRGWGNTLLKYCPVTKKVWQKRYDSQNRESVIVIYKDMPSYGLQRKPIPDNLKKIGA